MYVSLVSPSNFLWPNLCGTNQEMNKLNRSYQIHDIIKANHNTSWNYKLEVLVLHPNIYQSKCFFFVRFPLRIDFKFKNHCALCALYKIYYAQSRVASCQINIILINLKCWKLLRILFWSAYAEHFVWFHFMWCVSVLFPV